MQHVIKYWMIAAALFTTVNLRAQPDVATVLHQVETAHGPGSVFGYTVQYSRQVNGSPEKEAIPGYTMYCRSGSMFYDHGPLGKKLILDSMSISVYPGSQEIIVEQYEVQNPFGTMVDNVAETPGIRKSLAEDEDHYVIHFDLDTTFSIHAELRIEKSGHKLHRYTVFYRGNNAVDDRPVEEQLSITFTPIEPAAITPGLFSQEYVILTPETINPTPKYKTYDVYNLLF